MTSTLDSPAAPPKHVLVREHVRDIAVRAAPGTSVPSERELVQRFGVARMTVRQAIDALVGEGLLERTQGRGTFVAQAPSREPLVRGFSEEAAARGHRAADSRTLIARVERPGPNVARALGIERDEHVVHWKRLRLLGRRPAAIEDTFLPAERLPGLLESLTARSGAPRSLYEHLEERRLRPSVAEDTFRAVTAVAEEVALLGCRAGEPLLRVTRRGSREGRAILLAQITHAADGLVHVQRHDVR